MCYPSVAQSTTHTLRQLAVLGREVTMTSQQPVIEYFFSFVSLWSYIGSRRLQLLAQHHNAQIIYKPIDLARVFAVSGGLPVKERSVQRQAYRLLEMDRWTNIRGLPIVKHPKHYPADPSLAHRVLLAAIDELGHDNESVQEFARLGLDTVWADEGNIADPETIMEIANDAGLDGSRLLARAQEERGLAEQEEALSQEAINRSLFGAPTYFYRGEPFWGQDRLELLDGVILSGRPPLSLPGPEALQ
uniref:Glutathione S-transferase kappa n=1 Tax=Bionectria ochroleuca TaxID=29856 RepID=A0A8H7N5A1_BIOOC